MDLTRRRALAMLARVAALPLLAACPGPVDPEPAAEEPEDCDAGDLLEGDSDCYGDGGSKPKPKRTNAKPKTNTGGGTKTRTGGGSGSSRRR